MRYPLVFSLKSRKLLFIGGGKVAARRIAALSETGAEITVISEIISDEIKCVRKILKSYENSDINNGYYLVFVCTDNREVNRKAAEQAKKINIPVNICDDPENSDFHMPAVISTEEYTVSVSTKSFNPSFARLIKEKIQNFLR